MNCKNIRLIYIHKRNYIFSIVVFSFSCMMLSFFLGCSNKYTPLKKTVYSTRPYKINGKWYKPMTSVEKFKQKGIASWYGRKFHGRKTSSGEKYNMYALTAAHKRLPLGTCLMVLNLDNRKTVKVKVNDRGPFVEGRIIDLSYKAAKKIGIVEKGTELVEIYMCDSNRKSVAHSFNQNDIARYTIQVGAFVNFNNAQRKKNILDKYFNDSHIKVYKNKQHKILYGVRLYTGLTFTQATKKYNFLVQKGFKDAMLIKQ